MELEAKIELLKNPKFQLPQINAYHEIHSFLWPEIILKLIKKYPPQKFIIQEDFFYEHPSYNMKKKDTLLRNRKEIIFDIEFKNKEPVEKNLITFKGAKEKSKYKLREEIEFIADEKIWDIFEKLDFKKSISVKKYRWISEIKIPVPVFLCFDQINAIGAYLEIEIKKEDKINEDALKYLDKFLESEKLNTFKFEKKSYAALLAKRK
ncbi:MAG: CYTH domain-containing protein [Spirochaetia bacterium]|nr:CYTH domain-containing protein [Spirochaetia bacterium]